MRSFSVLSLLLIVVLGAMPLAASNPDLEPIPRPATGTVEDAVARDLDAAHDLVERQAGEGVEPEVLAGAYSELGQLYAAYELWDAARAALANSVRLAPDAVEPAYLLGYVEMRRGRPEEAARNLAAAAVLDGGGTLATWLRLGEAYLALDRNADARLAFEEALALAPSAAARFGLGRAAAREGDHAAAVAAFEKALELDPAADQIYTPLAQSLRRLEREEEAKAALARRGELSPGFSDPLVEALEQKATGASFHRFQGDQLVLARQFDAAVGAYRRAVAAEPSNFYSRKSLGLTLYHVGARGEAVQQLEAALRVAPETPDAEKALVTFTLAGMAANRGDLDTARDYFLQTTELDPTYADAYLQLGNLHGRKREWADAAKLFTQALEHNPDHLEALLNRATAYMDLGLFADAIPDLEHFLELSPGNERGRQLLEIAKTEAAKKG